MISKSNPSSAKLSFPGELPVRRVARGPLSDQVVRAIEDRAKNQVLKEGDRLPTERALAAQFGVGRSTVREAMRGLALRSLLRTVERLVSTHLALKPAT